MHAILQKDFEKISELAAALFRPIDFSIHVNKSPGSLEAVPFHENVS
jgi:hypothetical protein